MTTKKYRDQILKEFYKQGIFNEPIEENEDEND